MLTRRFVARELALGLVQARDDALGVPLAAGVLYGNGLLLSRIAASRRDTELGVSDRQPSGCGASLVTAGSGTHAPGMAVPA